jgi:hypothetical protein
MADDLKISDMEEVLSGDLHDDLQFEVIDPNEALVEDQNKRVKLVTLEASFGAEDKIFEGDSSVEVIDAGTGRIETTADANLIAEQALAEQKFSIEESDVGGLQLVFHIDGTTSNIYLGRQADLHLRVGTGSDPSVRVMSGTDIWFFADPNQQYIGSKAAGDASYIQATQGATPSVHIEAEDNTDVSFIDVLGDQILFSILGSQWLTLANDDQILGLDASESIHVNQSSGTIRGYIGGVTEWRLDSAGMKLKGGVTVNDIETTLTDDDTHLPTSGAVFDAIGAIQQDKILEGNSSVEVIDAGTGQVDVTVDAGLVARFLASGNMELGQDDTVRGILKFFGDAGGNGGRFELYKGASGTGSQRYYCEIAGNDFYLGQAFAETLSYTAATSMWRASPNFQADTLRLTTGATGIDTIETTLTDDDTHIPTSGAVVDAIAAITNTKIEQLNTKVEVSDTGTDGQVDIIADGFTMAKATAQGFFVGGTDGNFERMIHDAGAFYMINEFVNGDTIIRGTITGPTVQTMMRLYPDGGIDLHYNGALKWKFTADGMELKDDQTGAEAIGNAATTVAITFGTAHADANYQVLATVENTTDGGPLVLAAIITAKATTGFTATLSAATDSANYVLNWLVVRS